MKNMFEFIPIETTNFKNASVKKYHSKVYRVYPRTVRRWGDRKAPRKCAAQWVRRYMAAFDAVASVVWTECRSISASRTGRCPNCGPLRARWRQCWGAAAYDRQSKWDASRACSTTWRYALQAPLLLLQRLEIRIINLWGTILSYVEAHQLFPALTTQSNGDVWRRRSSSSRQLFVHSTSILCLRSPRHVRSFHKTCLFHWEIDPRHDLCSIQSKSVCDCSCAVKFQLFLGPNMFSRFLWLMLKCFSGENVEQIWCHLPGGPWIIASSLDSANTKASCWDSSISSWSCDGQFSRFVGSKWNFWLSEEFRKVKSSSWLIYAGITTSLETFMMYFSIGKSSSGSNLWRTPSVYRYALMTVPLFTWPKMHHCIELDLPRNTP